MAEYALFLNRLRHDLGKRFTVAAEHTTDSQNINVLVLRQRHDSMLTVVTETRWLAALSAEDTPTTRVEYKHLVVVVRHFFAHPDLLPAQQFQWPGTQESREEVRRTLNPRRRSRSSG